MCSRVCPVGIISMDDRGFPVESEDAMKRCIACGHCVAVCPHAALSLESMAADSCLSLPAAWNLSPEQADFFLKGRRSIRAFKSDAVPRASIEQIINTARYAPSGMNRQPVRWVIVYEQQKVREIAQETISWMKSMIKDHPQFAHSMMFENMVAGWEKGKDFICRNAPHLALLYGLRDDLTAPGACTIAGAYFELAALPHGLGTCWAGYAQMALNKWPACADIVNISKKCDCFAAFLLGYPQYSYPRVPLRNEPRISWR